MERLKILMIGPDRSVHGGISGVVNNFYAAGLAERVSLVYIGTMADGSKIRKLFWAVRAYVKFCIRLSHCDIVHVNMASDVSYYRKSIFIRTAYHFHKKIIIHQHGGDFQTFYQRELSDKGRKRLEDVFAKADAVIVLTSFWENFFAQIVDKKKIVVIPNGVNLPQMSNGKHETHKLLFLGRICKEKGIEELLETVVGLSQKYQDIQLYLGGIFEDEDLKVLAEQYPEIITLLGWVEGREKEKYLKLCNIFVLPSYFEGQPVSVLEAMSYACCVVASRVGGIPQMIEDNESGLLVEPGDKGSLKKALIKVLEDERFCTKLGMAAREKAGEEFSIDQSMEKLLSLYGKVLEY